MKTKVEVTEVKKVHKGTKTAAAKKAVATETTPPANPLWETDEQRDAREASKRAYALKCEKFVEPTDRRVMLKIKIRQLADEARLIRRKENGFPKYHNLRGQLRDHRVAFLRPAARNAQLALVFLRGKHAYADVEPGAKLPPDWSEVHRLVTAFGVYRNDATMTGVEFRKLQKKQDAAFGEWAGVEIT